MFRIGQKVVCVDASACRDRGIISSLKEGRIYTIISISSYRDRDNDRGLQVAEAEARVPSGFFKARRFRPVVEKKTDISIFTEILRRETVDDRAPARVIERG